MGLAKDTLKLGHASNTGIVYFRFVSSSYSLPIRSCIRLLTGGKSCVVHKSYGLFGSHCGRCIGLGQGNECKEVSPFTPSLRRRIVSDRWAVR